ncbi:hypothetical protein [Streptomyces adustus]
MRGNSPERQGSIASGEHASKALAAAGITTELIDLGEAPPLTTRPSA